MLNIFRQMFVNKLITVVSSEILIKDMFIRHQHNQFKCLIVGMLQSKLVGSQESA